MDNDIEIGPDHISRDGLELLLAHIRDQLLEIYPGMPRAIQREAADRAIARVWEEQLELNNGQQELIDRAQMRARIDELVEQYGRAPMVTDPNTGELDYDPRG